jgi:flagellar biosynthesis regulator FlbT
MPLRFDLGPFEQLHIGKTVLSNSHERAYLAFEGDVPIMRGKDVLQPETEHQGSYLTLAVQALKEEPSLHAELKQLDALFRAGRHYKALKGLKSLIRPSAFVVDRSEPSNYVRRGTLTSSI